MKRILFILFFFSALLLSGQSSTYFNKLIFPWISTNHLKSIVPYGNNFLVLSSWVDTPYYYNQSPALILLNAQGNILNQRLYLDTTHYYYFSPANSLVAASDSTFVMAGYRWNNTDGVCPFLMRVDANLDTICTRVFSHPDTLAASVPGAYIVNKFTCIRETWDKGFILSGYYNPGCNTTNTERSYLLKLDSLFNVEWIKKYSNIGISFNVETTADSGYYFVSMSQVNQIYKYDKLGNLEWQVNTNLSPPYVGSSGPVDLKVYDQNTLYVASGYWVEPVNGQRGFLLSKVDIPTRSVVWEKYYIMFNHIRCFTLDQHIRLLIAKDSNLIICANAEFLNPLDPSESGNKGFIAKLNPYGDSLWARHLGYGDFEFVNQINDIIITDDGGFLTVGFFTDWHPGIMYEDAWIVKLDSLGCDTPGCLNNSIDDKVLNMVRLKLFPNPSKEYFIIEYTLDKPNLPGALIEIRTIDGRLVKTIEVKGPQNQIIINTHPFARGMYLCLLKQGTNTLAVQKIVIEK
jgi:hypothetical protein